MTEIISGNLSEDETIVIGDAADQTGAFPAIASWAGAWIEPLQAALAGAGQ